MRNWVFVKVITRPGQFSRLGRGNAGIGISAQRGGGLSKTFRSYLVGEDPTRIEHLWQMMWAGSIFWHGQRDRAISTAIAGDRHIALLGYPRKVARSSLSQTVGRARSRLHPSLLSSGRWKKWSISTTTRRSTTTRATIRRASPGKLWRKDSLRSIHRLAVPVHDADRGTQTHQGRRSYALPKCAKRLVTTLISWSIVIRASVADDGTSNLQKRSSHTDFIFSKNHVGPESIDRFGPPSMLPLAHPIAIGERLTHLSAFRDVFRLAARAAFVSWISPIAVALAKRRRIAALVRCLPELLWVSAAQSRRGRSARAASLEFGFSQSELYIICETVHTDVPWRQDVIEDGRITIDKASPHG